MRHDAPPSLSLDARRVAGVVLITVPSILYGGLVLLGILTSGAAGLGPHPVLTPAQQALYRAGHAHAGVLVIFALLLQVLADGARLPGVLRWSARLAAPAAAILLPAGFFGLAHAPAMAACLYAGAAAAAFATVTVGVGLLRSA